MNWKEFLMKCDDVQEYWNERMPMMFMEEAGETIQAICKYERICSTSNAEEKAERAEEHLIEELGDMCISLTALCIQYNGMIDNFGKRLDSRIETKLNKKYDE